MRTIKMTYFYFDIYDPFNSPFNIFLNIFKEKFMASQTTLGGNFGKNYLHILVT